MNFSSCRPIERAIFLEYSDAPAEWIAVLCYAYEEAFAEKMRALGDPPGVASDFLPSSNLP